MITGLYEAHLPVGSLENSMEFYSRLGLKLAWRDEDTAFYWLQEGVSWLGLWEGKEAGTPYHPSLRHVAFRVGYEHLRHAEGWLRERGIEPVPFGGRSSTAQFVRPHQGNASVYFNDPDGNSLEFMCAVEVPEAMRHITDKLSLEQWDELSR